MKMRTVYDPLLILRLIKKVARIKIHQQDGFYWLQIGDDPMLSITREEYEQLKEWMNG